jgi:two-component system sensor histidine kinase CreC
MSKRNRIFLGILVIYALGVAYLLYRVSVDLDPRYKESAEELLVDTAHLLAALIEADIRDGVFHPDRLRPAFQSLYARRFAARIYDVTKTRADLRVYVTDRSGTVVFDSLDRDEGKDFRGWRDVALTLQGEYGARTTVETSGQPDSAVMYVAAPIRWNEQIVGAVSVGKPVGSFGQFIRSARHKLLVVGLTSGLSVIVIAVLVSVWLVRPYGLVRDYLRYVGEQRQLSPLRLARRALGALGAAYDEMRDALAGRSYVEEYVQTLTHEIKSPLSAIRGAAELLQEPMPEERRAQFLRNIREESERIQDLIDRLLELAALEKRRSLAPGQVTDVSLDELLREVLATLAPVAQARAVSTRITGAQGIHLVGDRFLLHRALTNLLQNAVDFSPPGGEVGVDVSPVGRDVAIEVRDHGPGIPDYALDRVFEKFYSLRRPDSGRKGTGLGLSFVKEIAQLHGGAAQLRNHPDGGALATLSLPRASS